MHISDKALYSFKPVLEDSFFGLNRYYGQLVFATRKVPGMPRYSTPKPFVYVYVAELVNEQWRRGCLIGLARTASLTLWKRNAQ